MKFDKRYPNAQPGQEIEYDGAYLFKSDKSSPCWHCKELTSWIDLSFETWLCSEECEQAKWNEYFAAYNQGRKPNECHY